MKTCKTYKSWQTKYNEKAFNNRHLYPAVIISFCNTTYQMTNFHDNVELEKSKSHIIVQIIEYIPNAVLSKTIIKKLTGNITISSLDAGEELAEKITPFDTYIQIIDGAAELNINDKLYRLKLGDGIIIPAHAKHHFLANEQFKMLSTIIKSGYED